MPTADARNGAGSASANARAADGTHDSTNHTTDAVAALTLEWINRQIRTELELRTLTAEADAVPRKFWWQQGLRLLSLLAIGLCGVVLQWWIGW